VSLVHILLFQLVLLLPLLSEFTRSTRDGVVFTYKTAFLFLRFSLAFIIIFRITVIWCQWKEKSFRKSKLWVVVKLMASNHLSIPIYLSSMLFLAVLVSPDSFILGSPYLDSFIPDHVRFYFVKNTTVLKGLESAVSLVGLIFMTRFPDNLKICSELTSLIFVRLFMVVFSEFSRRFTRQTEGFECGQQSLHNQFTSDCIRGLIFPFFLLVFSRYKQSRRVPSGLMYNLDMFCKDHQCCEVFYLYLQRKCSFEAKEAYERYIRENFDLQVDSSSIKQSVSIYESFDYSPSPVLVKAFSSFRLTRSFLTLKKIRVSAEEVESIGFTKA
jgi:hypothetical protein